MMGFNRIFNGREKKKPQSLDLRKQAHIRNIPDIEIENVSSPSSTTASTPSSSSLENAPSSPGLSTPATPMTPTSPLTRDFHILASLQMSIKSSNYSNDAYAVPPNTPMAYCNNKSHDNNEHLLDEYSNNDRNNPIDTRKQGRLCLTFALRNDMDIPAQDRIKLANGLEEQINKAYLGSDYRARIYTVGGILSEQPAVVRMLIKGEISAEEVAVAKTPFTPAPRLDASHHNHQSQISSIHNPASTNTGFGNDSPPPLSPAVVWSQEVPNSPKFKPE